MLKHICLVGVVGLLMGATSAQADDRHPTQRQSAQSKTIVINVEIVARRRPVVAIDVAQRSMRLEVAQNRASFVSKVENAAQREPF